MARKAAVSEKTKKYIPSKGFRITPEQAQLLGEAMESLGASRDLHDITAEELLASAESEDSPIHDLFEWNNRIAGHQHRISQARYYIRGLQVEYVINKRPVKTKAFHAVLHRGDDNQIERRFTPLSSIKTQEELRQQVIRNAWKQVFDWRQRYSEYVDIFGPLFKVIDEQADRVARG